MKIFLTCLILALSTNVFAQTTSRFPPLDKSPMDMSYYPVNYPVLKIQPNKKPEPLVARVIYSRPQKLGRDVFHELVEQGKVWRLGANEATEIEFFRDVKIGENKIKKGRYSLYAIENDQKWIFIINSEVNVWGAFKYDASKDICRIECPALSTNEVIEAFSIVFEKVSDAYIRLVVAWDNIQVSMPINLP